VRHVFDRITGVHAGGSAGISIIAAPFAFGRVTLDHRIHDCLHTLSLLKVDILKKAVSCKIRNPYAGAGAPGFLLAGCLDSKEISKTETCFTALYTSNDIRNIVYVIDKYMYM